MHASGGADSTSFDITNSCAYTVRAVISPGAGAAAALDSTGFVLAPGESRAVPVPSSVWSGRLWGRCTDCGSADSCQDCAGGNAAPPVTLVEFTIDGSRGIDLYDISVVDGYNLPVLVERRLLVLAAAARRRRACWTWTASAQPSCVCRRPRPAPAPPPWRARAHAWRLGRPSTAVPARTGAPTHVGRRRTRMCSRGRVHRRSAMPTTPTPCSRAAPGRPASPTP